MTDYEIIPKNIEEFSRLQASGVNLADIDRIKE